jgi:hypothetical protein
MFSMGNSPLGKPRRRGRIILKQILRIITSEVEDWM